jgi:hypothetical protein
MVAIALKALAIFCPHVWAAFWRAPRFIAIAFSS